MTSLFVLSDVCTVQSEIPDFLVNRSNFNQSTQAQK